MYFQTYYSSISFKAASVKMLGSGIFDRDKGPFLRDTLTAFRLPETYSLAIKTGTNETVRFPPKNLNDAFCFQTVNQHVWDEVCRIS